MALADILIGGLEEANKQRRETQALAKQLFLAKQKAQLAQMDAVDVVKQIEARNKLKFLSQFQTPDGQQGQVDQQRSQGTGQPLAVGQPGQQPSFIQDQPTLREMQAQQSLINRGQMPQQRQQIKLPQHTQSQVQQQKKQEEPYIKVPTGEIDFLTGQPKTELKKNPNFVPKSAQTKQQFDMANTLQDDFAAQSRDFFKIQDSFSRIIAAGQNPTAAGDLALIFNYMKMLDPGSVVRESEFANAQNSAGVPARVRATYNSIINGQRLDITQRDDFLDRAQSLFKSQSGIQKKKINIFAGRAKRFGLNKEDVVQPVIEFNLPKKQMKEPTATNPQTGEKIIFKNNKWQPVLTR